MNIHPVVSENFRFFRESLSYQKEHWMFSLTNRVVALCILLSAAIVCWKWTILPPAVPLWRSRPWGNDQLANPIWLFLLPAASFLWHILNITLAGSIARQHRIFGQVLYLSSLFVAILSCITVISVVFLVI